MSIAGLSMYVAPAPVLEATDALWYFIRDYVRKAGMSGVPDELDRTVDYRDLWSRPDLLMAQTCGFPYVKSLRGKVRLVATPCYGHPGCDGAWMRSFVIVNRNSGFASLDDLREHRAAINSHDSNSGYNLFRAALAPIAGRGRFFSKVLETGGHAASISAVAAGQADCAAIDCITYGNISRYEPDQLRDISVLMETPAGPGLPFVTRSCATDEDIELLRSALLAAVADPRLADVRDTLGLVDVAFLADDEYDRLSNLERDAAAIGYSAIA